MVFVVSAVLQDENRKGVLTLTWKGHPYYGVAVDMKSIGFKVQDCDCCCDDCVALWFCFGLLHPYPFSDYLVHI